MSFFPAMVTLVSGGGDGFRGAPPPPLVLNCSTDARSAPQNKMLLIFNTQTFGNRMCPYYDGLFEAVVKKASMTMTPTPSGWTQRQTMHIHLGTFLKTVPISAVCLGSLEQTARAASQFGKDGVHNVQWLWYTSPSQQAQCIKAHTNLFGGRRGSRQVPPPPPAPEISPRSTRRSSLHGGGGDGCQVTSPPPGGVGGLQGYFKGAENITEYTQVTDLK